MYRVAKTFGIIFAMCLTIVVTLYLYTLRKQRESEEFLEVLAEVRMGSTSKKDFLSNMTRLRGIKPPAVSSCNGEMCYEGIGYGIDNSVFGRFSLFPATNLAVGIYFDSHEVVQESIVTLDRRGVAMVTLDEQSELTAKLPQHKEESWSQKELHRALIILDQARPQDLARLSVSCFTSWFGCNTSAKLISGHN